MQACAVLLALAAFSAPALAQGRDVPFEAPSIAVSSLESMECTGDFNGDGNPDALGW